MVSEHQEKDKMLKASIQERINSLDEKNDSGLLNKVWEDWKSKTFKILRESVLQLIIPIQTVAHT